MYGTIGTELHALSSTSWIATGYFLTLTAFQPLYGKLCDIFGRKQCLLVAYLIFGVGCTCCGLARTMGELVAARAFAGIGGGGMTICTNVIFSDVMSLRERGVWQGYINVIMLQLVQAWVAYWPIVSLDGDGPFLARGLLPS